MVRHFTWDDRKEADNIRDHGVDFRHDAVQSFSDPFSQQYFDDGEGERAQEERWLIFGYSSKGLLVVCFTEWEETDCDDPSHEVCLRTHIISARKATPKERKDHEEGIRR
jgi:uncharacterized DUF497 family protein